MLNSEIVYDLCEKFELEDGSPPCTPESIVYAYDFNVIIREALGAEGTTFDDFQVVLEDYYVSSDKLNRVNSGFTEYYWVRYDLAGNGEYYVNVSFYPDDNLRLISFYLKDDS